MKIKRNVNGQDMEFELTCEEIYQAYYEQDRKFNQEDIESILEEQGLSVSFRQFQEIMDRFEDFLSNDDSWRYHAEAAIDFVLNETK